MGSSNHIFSSSSSSPRKSMLTRTKNKVFSIFCGASSSKSTPECPPLKLGDYDQISSSASEESSNPMTDGSRNAIVESFSVFSPQVGDTSSVPEIGESSGSNDSINNQVSCIEQACLSTNKEPISCQSAQDVEASSSTNQAMIISSGDDQSSSEAPCPTNSHSDLDEVEPNHEGVVDYNADLRSLSIASGSFRLPGDDQSAHEITTSSPGFLVSGREQDLRTEDLLHLDLMTISSNFLSSSVAEINSREARRNSRRLFWDALSRRSFRRLNDSENFVFATGLVAEDVRSRDRWHLDLSGNLHYDGAGRDLESLAGTRRHRNGRRWLLRSESSERTSDIDVGVQQSTLCSSGLHPNGTCQCDSLLTAEESSTLASISRIIVLAEALYEVLDEIHSQSLSLSLSMLSMPAPESVVDAFPLKFHKAVSIQSDSSEVQQCLICLDDYNEGDKLRVLPCGHEYHVSCIDKWLKEVNRVCPLCRSDVCKDAGESSVSNTEVPTD